MEAHSSHTKAPASTRKHAPPQHTGNMKSAVIALAVLVTQHVSGFVVGPASVTLARARVSRGTSSAAVEMNAAPKLVPFSKYQGLGNDFILVDNREAEDLMLTAGESADLCDRCVWGASREMYI